MTPFEKLGYKVGDKFEVVVDYLRQDYVKFGDVVTLYKDDDTNSPFFELEKGGIVCLTIHQIRPLKTEAEKRGAKFGVGGVVKSTGDKGVFWKSSSSYLGEEWYLFMNDGNILVMPSTQIRLDHEPEYREIPFSEATHEQRMVVKNLRLKIDEEILSIQISHCEGFYSITLGDGTVVLFYEDGSPILFREDSRDDDFTLTVRVPS